jgi:4-carboxymuconolactone decarboxylase
VDPAWREHWHGAAPTTGMAHYALSEQLEGKSVDWLEKLAPAQYPGSR